MFRSILIPAVLFCCILVFSCAKTKSEERDNIILEDNSVINLYDAFGEDREGLTKDFGFSCLIRYKGKTILFDAGTNAETFRSNVEAMNIDLTKVDMAIASHAHFDHINGFDHLLEVNPNVKIYFPFDLFWGANLSFNLSGKDPSAVDDLPLKMQYFGGDYEDFTFNQSGRFRGANVEFVQQHKEIAPGIRLIFTRSPYMGYFNKYPGKEAAGQEINPSVKLSGLPELSLSLETKEGEVLFVGCSHSTVERIVKETIEQTENDIQLLYGGYHLLPYQRETLQDLASTLKSEFGVKHVAPTHCTGHLGFEVLRQTFGKDYLFAGLGELVFFEEEN